MIKIAKVGDRIDGPAVYVGRNPKFGCNALGNPFVIGEKRSRAESIEEFRVWFEERVRLKCLTESQRALLNKIAALSKVGDVTLVCHCNPLDCHARIIKEVVDAHCTR